MAPSRHEEVHELESLSPSISSNRPEASHNDHISVAAPYAPTQPASWHRASRLLSFLAGIMWLGPAIWILYSNFSESVIGGSLSCGNRSCSVVDFSLKAYKLNITSVINAVEADKEAHDLLGGIQFAAKAFEIWFILIAGSLLYAVSYHMIKQPAGLPLGYLLAHVKFADLSSIFKLVTWTSSRPSNHDGSRPTWKQKANVYGFLALFLALSILSNFIGPLTAVLLNPSLDWDDGSPVDYGRLGRMRSSGPVTNGQTSRDDNFRDCRDESALASGDYSCLLSYAEVFDALIENVNKSINQGDPRVPSDTIIWYDAYSSESLLRFNFNGTPPPGEDNFLTTPSYSPNRQVIRGLATDLWSYINYTLGKAPEPLEAFGPDAELANNSVLLQIQRQGPVIGSTSFLLRGVPYTAYIGGSNRQIRCFDQLLNLTEQAYTKCYRWGNWSPDSTTASLTLQGVQDTETDTSQLDIYWSDKYAYFIAAEFQEWRRRCIRNFTSAQDYDDANAQCDWQNRFENLPTPPKGLESSGSGLVTEYRITDQPADENRVFVSEFNPSVTTATYSVDVTDIFGNPMEVTLPAIQVSAVADRRPLVLNASWALATWTTPDGGVAAAFDRPAARMIHSSLENVYRQQGNVRFARRRLHSAVQAAGLQMLSMVTFDTIGEGESTDDGEHPLLSSYFHRQVWKYGFESRTRRFGLVVTILGCLVVLVRSALVLVWMEKKPTSVELLRGAFEHEPDGEFKQGAKEREAARVRFRILSTSEKGVVKFAKPLG